MAADHGFWLAANYLNNCPCKLNSLEWVFERYLNAALYLLQKVEASLLAGVGYQIRFGAFQNLNTIPQLLFKCVAWNHILHRIDQLLHR
jgi:hypothetical protein